MSTDRAADRSEEAYDLFVDGEFRPSEGDERIPVEYPYDGTIWASVPAATAADVDEMVTVAAKAFESWRDVRPSKRSRILRQIGDVVWDHAEELGRLETRQNGKLIREMVGQMKGMAKWYQYFASLAQTIEGRTPPVENKRGQMFNYTYKVPYGVVGAITAWNSPLLLTAFKLAPALAAGNAFIHKPSEHTPVSALRFAELLHEHTDLPDGVYNVVTGAGPTGQALVEHEGVDKLAFTGSTGVGREIGKQAGERLVPVTLELGGKNPNIVFPSADLDNAITGSIEGIFGATGQTCVAGSRIFVHEDVYEAFVARLEARAESIELGDPLEYDTEMGPLAFLAQRETVEEYVEIGTTEGAEISVGGGRPDDLPGECFFQPTILTDVTNDMRVAREEVFGPVASVVPFTEEDEVVAQANDSPYGLAAGLWTEDMRQAFRVERQLEAGTIWINEYRTMSYETPFGGFKDSGLGRENGREGLEEYLQTKSVWIDLSGESSDPFKPS
jgi:aldehyde dehydrogenase (NAD+)